MAEVGMHAVVAVVVIEVAVAADAGAVLAQQTCPSVLVNPEAGFAVTIKAIPEAAVAVKAVGAAADSVDLEALRTLRFIRKDKTN